MHSVRDPWSHRERYMRAAPIDLCSSSQNHLTAKEKTEWTNRMATKVGAGKEVSIREGDSTNIIFISYLLAQ